MAGKYGDLAALLEIPAYGHEAKQACERVGWTEWARAQPKFDSSVAPANAMDAFNVFISEVGLHWDTDVAMPDSDDMEVIAVMVIVILVTISMIM